MYKRLHIKFAIIKVYTIFVDRKVFIYVHVLDIGATWNVERK